MPEAKRAAIIDYILSEAAAPSASRPGESTPDNVAKAAEPSYAFAGFRRWLDPEGYPAIKPPWGTLNGRRSQHWRDQMESSVGRVPRADRTRHPTNRHRELWWPGGNRQRPPLHWGDGR